MKSGLNKHKGVLSDVSRDRSRFKIVWKELRDRTVGRLIMPVLPCYQRSMRPERFEKVGLIDGRKPFCDSCLIEVQQTIPK